MMATEPQIILRLGLSHRFDLYDLGSTPLASMLALTEISFKRRYHLLLSHKRTRHTFADCRSFPRIQASGYRRFPTFKIFR
jgi:hypothetical protein